MVTYGVEGACLLSSSRPNIPRSEKISEMGFRGYPEKLKYISSFPRAAEQQNAEINGGNTPPFVVSFFTCISVRSQAKEIGATVFLAPCVPYTPDSQQMGDGMKMRSMKLSDTQKLIISNFVCSIERFFETESILWLWQFNRGVCCRGMFKVLGVLYVQEMPTLEEMHISISTPARISKIPNK